MTDTSFAESKAVIAELNPSGDTNVTFESLKNYLRNICPIVLNVPSHIIDSQLEASESMACLAQFVSSSDVMVLFALKLEGEHDGKSIVLCNL